MVGSTRITYDIYGETVHIAKEMEQTSMANEVHITDDTYMLLPKDLKDKFQKRIGVVMPTGRQVDKTWITQTYHQSD